MFKTKYKEIEQSLVKLNQSVVSQHDNRIRVNDSVINMSELIKRLEVIHKTKVCLFRRSLRRRLHRILSRRQSPMQPATKIPPKQQHVHLYLLSVMLGVYSENSRGAPTGCQARPPTVPQATPQPKHRLKHAEVSVIFIRVTFEMKYIWNH